MLATEPGPARRSSRSTKVQQRETWRETQRERERGCERQKTAGETGHIDISSEKKMKGERRKRREGVEMVFE